MSTTYYKWNIIFLVSIITLSMLIFVQTESDEYAKKKTEVNKLSQESKDVHKKSHRKNKQIDVSNDKSMKINNNLHIKGNITSSKIKTKNINITGQAIIAKTLTTIEIESDKLGAQTIYANEISSPNVS